MVPLRVCKTRPSELLPPHGDHHPFDKDGEALALVRMAMPASKVHIDCLADEDTAQLLEAGAIAAKIAAELRKGSESEAGALKLVQVMTRQCKLRSQFLVDCFPQRPCAHGLETWVWIC